MTDDLLRIRDLQVCFINGHRFVNAVDRISFTVKQGEFLALIGESGSGKTVTALSIMGLLPGEPGLVRGAIEFDGRSLTGDLDKCVELREANGEVSEIRIDPAWHKSYKRLMAGVRGDRIGMIFQEPAGSLDPYFTVGDQLLETIHLRSNLSPAAAREKAEFWLEQVSLPAPKRIMRAYPHELSGGMSQRVMIALALCNEPDMLIADEPTTALDATIQKEIMLLIARLQETFNLSILFITHDMSLVRSFADRIAVMFQGKIVDIGPAVEMLDTRSFRHPFTERLLEPIPEKSNLLSLPVAQPQPLMATLQSVTNTGCVYVHRCPLRLAHCGTSVPPEIRLSERRRVACWLAEKALSGQEERYD